MGFRNDALTITPAGGTFTGAITLANLANALNSGAYAIRMKSFAASTGGAASYVLDTNGSYSGATAGEAYQLNAGGNEVLGIFCDGSTNGMGLNFYDPSTPGSQVGQFTAGGSPAFVTLTAGATEVVAFGQLRSHFFTGLRFSRALADHTSSPYGMTAIETFMGATTAGGVVTVTLPNPVTTLSSGAGNGWFTIIKDEGGVAATSNITVSPFGTEKIDGVAASKTINTNYGSLRLYTNGTNWFTW